MQSSDDNILAGGQGRSAADVRDAGLLFAIACLALLALAVIA